MLRCYVGMAMAKLNRLEEAEDVLRQAIEADPNNPLARYELANVLMAMHELPRARKELETLKVCSLLPQLTPPLFRPT